MNEKTSLDDFFQAFHIGTYYLQKNARSERHIKELWDCGIDLVFGLDNDKDALELFQKYGIRAVVSGIVPGWFGGHGENAGTMREANKPEAYITGANSFSDHPAIVGIDLGDEPSSLDFPYYGEVVALTKTLFPGKFLYLNLYPSYGMLAASGPVQAARELGKDTYAAYLKAYCDAVELPYLSFDHYVYSSHKDIFLQDLHDAASCCKTSGKALFVVLQVNSHREEVFLSADQLRFQAFSAIAFGARCISWACYSAGWWYHQVLDEAGEKTPQYKKLKAVNEEVRHLAQGYFPYKWQKTVRLDSTPCTLAPLQDISSSVSALMGVFADEANNPGFFFSPLDYETENPCSLRVRYEGQEPLCCRTASGTTQLVSGKDGRYEVSFDRPEPCFLFFGA